MLLTLATTAAALALGALVPRHWGVLGFLAAAAALFLAQTVIRTASGFSDSTIEESLLLFNGSWTSYVGFNMQLTYRAFAVPVLALATVILHRTFRAAA